MNQSIFRGEDTDLDAGGDLWQMKTGLTLLL